MIYAIAVCLGLGASAQCHVDDSVWTSPFTFDSAQACLAYLPRILGGARKVSADGRLYMNAGWYECVSKQTWQPVQPQEPAPAPKSYTIVICFKTEALAKAAAGPGGWKRGDAPCIQDLPAFHGDGLDCFMELAKMAESPGSQFVLDAHPDAADQIDAVRLYQRNGSRDAWVQCFETTQ
jgi:hypothetical protein